MLVQAVFKYSAGNRVSNTVAEMHLTTNDHFYFQFNCLLRSTKEFQIILVCFISQLWNTLLQLHKNKDLKIISMCASSLLPHPRMLKALKCHGCNRAFGKADQIHTGHMACDFLLSYKEENSIIKWKTFQSCQLAQSCFWENKLHYLQIVISSGAIYVVKIIYTPITYL